MKTIPTTLLLLSSALGFSAEAPAAKAVAPVQTPARFLEDVDDRIAKLRQRLAIADRERGPFGLYQVPGKAPVITSAVEQRVRKTPFNEFINEIQISVVNAKEKEFLVGARMFRLGQVFPIVRGGERLSVRVESVAPSKVSFKNLKTGEIALRRLDVLPDGVTASAGSLRVQGVTPDGRVEAEPLRLEYTAPPRTP